MSEAEQVYSSRQVAALLGLGSAMLRRYAVSYEQVTGSQLQLDRRDGRIFTQTDVDVLSQARQLVATQGLPVDTAIKTALDKPELVSVPPVGAPAVNAEALAAVLSQAITEAQRPLLSELQDMNQGLQALQAEVEALRLGQAEAKSLPPGATPERIDRALEVEMLTEAEDGVMVKAARWLERRIKGR
jgi:DNA-binding transcriptional MerR regulator